MAEMSLPLNTELAEHGRMTEYRAVFDAEVTFRNGGGLQTQGFRLDLPSADTTEQEIADLLIGHLGLLAVDQVHISQLQVVNEQHKGSRGVPTIAGPTAPSRLVELNHVIEAGMTTYPGLPDQRSPHT